MKRACSSSDTFKYGISGSIQAPLCSLTQLKLLTPLRYTRDFLSAFLLPFLFKYSLTDTTFSFGRAGVECYCQHDSGAAVIQLQFLINEVCPVLSLFVYPSSLLIFDWQASLHSRDTQRGLTARILHPLLQGALVSALADDSIHLWNLRQKIPAILHSLKFNRERYSNVTQHLSLWLSQLASCLSAYN